MNVYRSLEEAPRPFGPCALTIGNFDGVHCGHRRILQRVKALATANGWKSSVLTFDPHPACVVAPERAPRLMTSPLRRAELMAEEGIEQVLILPFTRELAQLTPLEFARQLLVERLDAKAVLVGDNFRFGHSQAGDVRVLAALGAQLGFVTETIHAVEWRGRIVSSSGAREAILAGRVALAARLLQHAYGVEGDVVSGRGIGSRETVPTLNLSTAAALLPAPGVYVTRTRDLEDGREWRSITNIGYRPTYGASGRLTIETFLLGALTGSTPRRIRVEFLLRIRDERRFDSAGALKSRILRDARAATAYFRRSDRWVRRAE